MTTPPPPSGVGLGANFVCTFATLISRASPIPIIERLSEPRSPSRSEVDRDAFREIQDALIGNGYPRLGCTSVGDDFHTGILYAQWQIPEWRIAICRT